MTSEIEIDGCIKVLLCLKYSDFFFMKRKKRTTIWKKIEQKRETKTYKCVTFSL